MRSRACTLQSRTGNVASAVVVRVRTGRILPRLQRRLLWNEITQEVLSLSLSLPLSPFPRTTLRVRSLSCAEC